MTTKPREYWWMILTMAWTAAWSRARSWSALAVIVVGIAGAYIIVPNELRIRLAWQIPLFLLTVLLLIFVPIVIYRSHNDLEKRVTTSSDQFAGKWFHTVNADNQIQFQGRVLENRSGMLFVQLYSFLDGEPTTRRFMTAQEQQTARFYDSHDAMLAEYERLHPPRVP